LRPGDSTPFSFSLDPETRLAGECKVSWVEEDGRVAGLEFTSIPKELPGTVREWLRENSFAVPPSAIPAKQPAKEASTLQELREELRSITSNARTAERDEKKADASQRKKETKAEAFPVQKQTADVAPAIKEVAAAINLVSNSEERNESLERSKDLAPFPELEPLPTFPDVEVVPDPVHVKRGYARSGISIAIRMTIVLALVACALAYHRPLGNAIIWFGQQIAGSNVPEISYTPNTEESQPGQASVSAPGQLSPTPPQTVLDKDNSAAEERGTVDNPTSSTPAKKSIEIPPAVENTPPQPKNSRTSTTAAASAPLPATNRTTTYAAPPIPAPDLAGQQEYLSAQEILKNNNTETNLPEAVHLLWVAVEKGNSNAEVLLAELYRTGQGVTKSCDQTKILLTAAAKKGNSEAQRHLGQFEKEGCE